MFFTPNPKTEESSAIPETDETGKEPVIAEETGETEETIETGDPENDESVGREYNMGTGGVGSDHLVDDVIEPNTEDDSISQPYGLPLVGDLLSFLSSLIDQHERQNADLMIKTGLSLIMVALEVARDTIAEVPELLDIVKNDLSKHLYQLLSCDK